MYINKQSTNCSCFRKTAYVARRVITILIFITVRSVLPAPAALAVMLPSLKPQVLCKKQTVVARETTGVAIGRLQPHLSR